MPDRTDEYRDDTAYGLTGAGPLTMHAALDMPLPHEVQLDQLHTKAVSAYERGDAAAVMDTVVKMAALRHCNTNSGAVAPIQGQE